MTITLVIRSVNGATYTTECPLLETLAPDFREPPRRWDCGPATFDFLLDFLLERYVPEEQRKPFVAMVAKGEWDLVYRCVVIHRGKEIPEGRLWPM